MKLLISFCNSKPIDELNHEGTTPLAIIDTSNNQLTWIKLPLELKFNSITGLSQNTTHIFAAFSGEQIGIFSINKLTLDVKHTLIKYIYDPHSIAVIDNYLYIVSTGNDTVFKHEILPDNYISQKGKIFWKPKGSKGLLDTHHLNSLFYSPSNLLVSGFGPKENKRWSSAKNGYIYDLINNKYVIKNIYHPHSIFKDIKLKVCESSTSSILINGSKELSVDSGYVRGLYKKSNSYYIGISSGRKVSKSTGITNNPAEKGEIQINCKLVFGKNNKYYFYDFSTFHKEIYAIIPVNISTPTINTLFALNKFQACYSKKNKTIYLSTPTQNDWKYSTPEFEFLQSNPEIELTTGWAGHKNFAYDLVTNTNPKTIVELGTFYGFSLFSMAQAVKDNNYKTKIYGIDTWKGDKHAGRLTDNTFLEVKSVIKKHYSELNIKLIKSLFSHALNKFENKSIDILHIDGLHTYNAVKKDFLSWLPKLSENGIIIFHDTNVTKHDFGVKVLWDELKKKNDHWEFFHSNGLGIIFLGHAPKNNYKYLLNSYYTNISVLEKEISQNKQKVLELVSTNTNQSNTILSQNISILNLENSLYKIQSSKTYRIWQKYNEIKRLLFRSQYEKKS
jgi:hypothetical protein